MKKDNGIDWGWVESELSRVERLSKDKSALCKYAAECVEEARSLVDPRIVSAAKRIVSLNPDSIELEGGVTFLTGKISSYIKCASHLNIYAATIGGELEARASGLMSKDEELRGYLLDRIGSLAVESLAEDVEKTARRGCLIKGKSVSRRFSPGYCDWPLGEQKKLASVLDFSKIGISLTEKCMMVPKKSISAVMGIGPKGLFDARGSPCARCAKEPCDYRR